MNLGLALIVGAGGDNSEDRVVSRAGFSARRVRIFPEGGGRHRCRSWDSRQAEVAATAGRTLRACSLTPRAAWWRGVLAPYGGGGAPSANGAVALAAELLGAGFRVERSPTGAL